MKPDRPAGAACCPLGSYGGAMSELKCEAEWKIATLRGHADSVLRACADLAKAHRYPYAVMLSGWFVPHILKRDPSMDRLAEHMKAWS